jgi:hypothetical protein
MRLGGNGYYTRCRQCARKRDRGRERPRVTGTTPGSHGGERVNAGPLLELLRDMFPGWTAHQIALLAGYTISDRRLRDVLNERQDHVELETVDRLLTRGLGRPDLLYVLYPLDTP